MLGMPESSCPPEQSREHCHTEMFRAAPKSSCFLCPFSQGASREVVAMSWCCTQPFLPEPFPGELGSDPQAMSLSPAQLLLAESELLVASQYLRALLQRKMVCKSREERGQLCQRLLQDATQLRELFCGLVRGAGVSITSPSRCPPAHSPHGAVTLGRNRVEQGLWGPSPCPAAPDGWEGSSCRGSGPHVGTGDAAVSHQPQQ